MTVLKENCVIQGLDISSAFYEQLQGVVFKLAEGGVDNKGHVEVMLILLSELDRLAGEQGLLDVISVK